MTEKEINYLRYRETKLFNDNASRLLIESKRLREFLESIGLKLYPGGDRIEFVCPICKERTAYLWHSEKSPIGWACRRGCHDTIKYKNLMSLTRVCAQCPFGEVYRIIAGFLGFRNPNEITNGMTTPGIEASPGDGIAAPTGSDTSPERDTCDNCDSATPNAKSANLLTGATYGRHGWTGDADAPRGN